MSLYQHPMTPTTEAHRVPALQHSLRRKTSNITASSAAHSRSTTPTPRIREPSAHAPEDAPTGTTTVPQTPGLVKRVSYANLPSGSAHVAYAPVMETVNTAVENSGLVPPPHMSQADFTRAVTIATVSALRHQHVHSQSPARARVSGGAVVDVDDGGGHGGHDAPSWSRGLSASVLLGCTFLYAIIAGKTISLSPPGHPSLIVFAEILVDVVDVVLKGSGLDEKFLGVTLFALVPNTTEFMNAMAFAMGGNIALSMEIGSAYALQVCLLQIPAMVAFSAWYTGDGLGTAANTFK
jgi:Ca2+:H+ antiporter